jgi:uncharacterized protein
MMFVVDTNVLVYAAERSFPEHERCRALVLEWRKSETAWYATWGVVYEFLRVVTHPRVFRKPWDIASAWSFVTALLAAPGFGLLVETDKHAAIVDELLAQVPFAAGNLMHDLHTVALMREHGVRRIVTRDADFHRFSDIETVDPLAAS